MKKAQEKASLLADAEMQCSEEKGNTHTLTHSHTYTATASCFQCLIEQRRTHRGFCASFVTSLPQKGCDVVRKEVLV